MKVPIIIAAFIDCPETIAVTITAGVSELLTAFRLAVGFAVVDSIPDSVPVAAVVPAPAGLPQRPRNASLSKAP